MATESLCPDHGGTSVKSKCKQCKRERDRRYRQENREKIAERNRRYYEENRDKELERGRRYRQENRDEIAEQNRRYRQENREKIAEKERRYREKNREKIAERHRRYYQENRSYIAAQAAKHGAVKNRASQYLATNKGKPWTPQEVAKMHRLQRQGLSRYEIANELGRTLNAVNYRITEENARH